jgi:hypothetical protein
LGNVRFWATLPGRRQGAPVSGKKSGAVYALWFGDIARCRAFRVTPVAKRAKCAAALAERFERARKKTSA